MSVANVSDASQGLAQYFQRLSSGTQSASPQGAIVAPDAQDPQSAQAAQPMHHHHHGGGGSAMRGKIESAVTTALQNYTGDGDVNQVIQSAITTAISSGASSTSTTDPTTGATTTPTVAATAAPTDPTTAASQSSDAFQQLLSSKGIDPSQFRDDMMAAFKSARGTETASSGAITALPAGSYVDAEG